MSDDLGRWCGARSERIWPAVVEAALVVVLIVVPALAVLAGLLAVVMSVSKGP